MTTNSRKTISASFEHNKYTYGRKDGESSDDIRKAQSKVAPDKYAMGVLKDLSSKAKSMGYGPEMWR